MTWLSIETAPKDRTILVYAPGEQGLDPIICACRWHDDAGFYVDELRSPTHWMPLPEPPKTGGDLKRWKGAFSIPTDEG